MLTAALTVAVFGFVSGLRDVSEVQRIYDFTRRVKAADCCTVCLCRVDDSVSCVGRQLFQVPDNIPKSVRYLDLRSNRISVLPRKVISGLPNLTQVLLSGNELQAMHRLAFVDLPSLVRLDLSHNQLDTISLDLSTSTVEELDLSWNKLDLVADSSALNSAGFKSLNFSHNLLKAPRLILEESFANFTSLETLDLSGNVFTSLVTASLRHLPESVTNLSLAKCDIIESAADILTQAGKHLQRVDLSGNFLSLNELKEIFAAMQNNSVTTLELRNLDLQEVVPDPCFPGWDRVRRVDMSSNKIEIVSDIAFQGTGIEALNLAGNSLKTHSLKLTSANLPQLRSLRLDGNTFDAIPALELANLRYLDLSHNQISELNVTELDATELRSLSINHNSMDEFDTTAFSEFMHLEYLDVSHNLLTSFDMGTLVVRRLRTLKLDRNELTTLYVDSSRPLHLETLSIGWNKFTNLSKHLFDRLPSLRRLNLAGNQHLFRPHVGPLVINVRRLARLDLSDLDLVSLNGIRLAADLCVDDLVLAGNALTTTSATASFGRCLRSLDLSRNKLTELNVTFLDSLPALHQVNLAHNPYICECSIQNFYHWLRTTDVTVQNYDLTNSYVCSAPNKSRGLAVWAPRKELESECAHWTLSGRGLYVTFALTAIALTAILVTIVFSRDTLFSCKRSKLFSSKLYTSCSEKVRGWREASQDYPHLFSPAVGLARSPSVSGYRHLDAATDTSC